MTAFHVLTTDTDMLAAAADVERVVELVVIETGSLRKLIEIGCGT